MRLEPHRLVGAILRQGPYSYTVLSKSEHIGEETGLTQEVCLHDPTRDPSAASRLQRPLESDHVHNSDSPALPVERHSYHSAPLLH
jgi:hypothetical protein